ncbi:lactonase family protein [Aestuariimicrobium ganziense]|uniref:lactonase family protein n=1 Tax=Aestuariimicrobium ganziense TaxID=2773677 RepID=UPI00194090F2|nr:beta-propeller fold lactonase family protein [Aestuariimicrobium ganziense]
MSSHSLVLVAAAGDSAIAAFRLEGEQATPLATTTGLPGTGCFAVDAARDLVHAGVKADDEAGTGAAVVTLRLDRATGALEELSRREVDDSFAYLHLTADGRFLLGASYGGNTGLVWPVADDGSLGEATSRIEYTHLHCVVTHGDSAYFVALGDDLVTQYRLDDDGVLSPLDPPTVSAPRGSGPRHLVVDPDGANAYLMTEFSGEAIRFDRDPSTGVLTTAEALPAYDTSRGLGHSELGADPLANHYIWGADLHLAGDLLICSERTESTLTTIRLDREGHLVEVLAHTPTEQQPRGFLVTGDPALVLAVGEKSTDLAVHRVEPDGSLPVVDRVPTGKGANWVRVV